MIDEIEEGYDRVTSVLSFASGFDKIPEPVLKVACDRGTAVHEAIDGIIKGLGEFIDDEHKGYIESFKQWADGKKLCPSPGRFYCDQHMITGEIDCIWQSENGTIIIDFKTPMKESKSWNLQASAYQHLAYRNHIRYLDKVCDIQFIRLNKYGKYPIIHEYEYNIDLFLSYLDVYRHAFKDGKEEINIEDL